MLSYLRPWLGANQNEPADQIAREISERSVSEARQRLGADVSAMSLAELRGYVRARATRPVRQHAQQVMIGHGRHVMVENDLISRALERTVHLVVRQLTLQPAIAQRGEQQGRQRAG